MMYKNAIQFCWKSDWNPDFNSKVNTTIQVSHKSLDFWQFSKLIWSHTSKLIIPPITIFWNTLVPPVNEYVEFIQLVLATPNNRQMWWPWLDDVVKYLIWKCLLPTLSTNTKRRRWWILTLRRGEDTRKSSRYVKLDIFTFYRKIVTSLLLLANVSENPNILNFGGAKQHRLFICPTTFEKSEVPQTWSGIKILTNWK